MKAPFTAEQFFEVFAHYNAGIWPAQYVLLILGFAAAIALFMNVRTMSLVLPVVAFLWLWMALIYFAAFFSTITLAAYLFAIAFVVEALFLIGGAVTRLTPHEPSRHQRIVAAVLFAYALVGYPLIGLAAGQRYPESETFGLPCPTVIFTFGVLCLLARSVTPATLMVPVLWSFFGSVAALQFGVTQDFALPIAAAATLLFALPPRAVTRWKEAI